jgi:hypothetical protein
MTRKARWLVAGAGALVACWALSSPGAGAAEEELEIPKDVKDTVLNMAKLIADGKGDEAKKLGAALVKKKDYDGSKLGSTKEVMHVFSQRKYKGFGFGEKPMKTADGIEAKIMDLGKKVMTPTKLKTDMPALKQLAYVTLAVAELTAISGPKKDVGKKLKKDWDKYAKEMQDGSKALLDAIEEKDEKKAVKAINIAAKTLDGTCTSCHQAGYKPSS